MWLFVWNEALEDIGARKCKRTSDRRISPRGAMLLRSARSSCPPCSLEGHWPPAATVDCCCWPIVLPVTPMIQVILSSCRPRNRSSDTDGSLVNAISSPSPGIIDTSSPGLRSTSVFSCIFSLTWSASTSLVNLSSAWQIKLTCQAF